MNEPIAPVELSIVIVSWNVRDLLRACLRSIEQSRRSLPIEVIIVDAASSDGSVAMVAEEFPWVIVAAQSENVGYPRGNNIGMAAAKGDYILILNPDTEIVGDALVRMISYMKRHANIGVLGPQLLNPDGSVQSSRRRFPTLATGFFESTWLEGLAPGILRDYYMLDLDDNAISEVDWVVGACLMVPSKIFREVGGMDESYYMYSEELDWCRRIKSAGWRVVYFPDAQVKHYYGKSSEQAIVHRHINFQRAKLRYFRKYHGRFPAAVLRLYLLLNYSIQMVLEGFKGLVGHKRPLRRQRVRAYYEVIRSGLRPAGY